MNKSELEAKLHNYEERLKDVAKAIKETREQLAEAEKPEPRHGDFGIEDGCRPTIILRDTRVNAEFKSINKDHSCQSSNRTAYHHTYTILGNVFDLMKEWSEPFEEWGDDKASKGIKIVGNRIEFYACTDGSCSKRHRPCLDNVEEFYNALGHAIADLKRKENKNE